MAKYDDSEGVWRTIGGRRVFIRTGQSLSDAMKESGKFKKKKQDEYDDLNDEEENTIKYEGLEKYTKIDKEKDLLKDKELQKAVGEDLKKSFENVKDGKYYRNRLKELDSADTPSGTYDIETGEAVDFKGKGYSVSFEQTGVELTDQQYIAKINECRDRCDGNVYFGKFGGTPEVSFHTDDINEAIKIMKENNQHSIYDIANDTEILNDEYDASTNKIKDLSQVKALTSKEATKNQINRLNEYEDVYDAYDKAMEKANEPKSMNEKIREKASKKSTFKDDLPKRTEIKTQGTSNRKEVSENIQAHILDYYDSPEDFIEQMDVFDNMPTKWHAGQEMAKQGFYDIYYEDQRKFLNDLKINPNGKEFSDDKVFQTYTSLIGRESAKLYDRLMKNEYNKYRQSHPLTKMTLEEFIKSRKER